MNRNRPLPGSRLLLYAGGLIGLFRTADQSLDETGAPVETIDPFTRSEPQDINVRAVLLAGAATLLALWAIVVVVYPLFKYFSYERTGGQDPAKVLAYLPPQPPAPRDQAHPHRVLKDFRAQEETSLNNYNWVDRSKGLVSIPIGRAMALLAQRGIPPSNPGGKDYYPPLAGSKLTGLEGKVRPEPR